MLDIVEKLLITIVGLCTIIILALLYTLLPNFIYIGLGKGALVIAAGYLLTLSCYFVGMVVIDLIEYPRS